MKQKKYAKKLYPSPIGTLSLVADEQYLYGIWVQDQTHFERGIAGDSIEVVKKHPVLDQVISYLDTYFDGCAQDLSSLPLAPIGTDFEKRVWDYLQAIPYGQTVTYGQIAKDLHVTVKGVQNQPSNVIKVWEKWMTTNCGKQPWIQNIA